MNHMADIDRLAGSDIVMFSAHTPAAELWMKELYGRAVIYFHVPSDHERMRLFVKAARSQGFTIAEGTGA